MVKASDIGNEDTLHAWLDGQPREVSIAIAARAAQRVMPIWAAFSQSSGNTDRDLTALVVLWPNLIAGVAGTMPPPAMSDAAAYAADAARSAYAAYEAADAAGYAAAQAADAAAQAADAAADAAARSSYAAYAAADAASRSAYAAADAAYAAADVADAVFLEGGGTVDALLCSPLWPGENPLQKQWEAVRAKWAKPKSPYDFWLRWYDSLLDPEHHKSFPVELLHEIATLSPDLWQGADGPEKIAKRIDGLERKFGENHAPFDPDETEQLKEMLALEQERNRALASDLKEQRRLSNNLAAQQKQLAEQLSHLRDESAATLETIQSQYEVESQKSIEANEKKFDAAIEAYKESKRIEEPIELWEEKHENHKTTARKFFWVYLGFLVVLFLALVWGLDAAASGGVLDGFLTSPPCVVGKTCSAFSLKGGFIAGAVLTMLTLALWVARLLMKIYLSERHLALDALERKAFTEVYLGLLREGDVSEEMQEYRGIVYSAVFRPTTDGMVKDDGGLDPSVSAAISKFLSK